jgi:predicted NUDIX family phosphoesterase
VTKHTELILAVRRDRLPHPLGQHGFQRVPFPETFEVLSGSGLWLGPRRLLEDDPSFLQLIPYIVLANEDGVLCYRRSKSSGESRLHDQWSIGIGGHVDANDVAWLPDHTVDLWSTLNDASDREVSEEVGNLVVEVAPWFGVVHDGESEVGRVHLGVVSVWSVDGPMLTKAEHTLVEHKILTPRELEEHAGNFESWSRMIVPAIVEELGK